MEMADNPLSNSTSDPGPSRQSGPTTSPTNKGTLRFPPAAQPEIMRTAATLFVIYSTKLIGQMLYYVLTTGSGQQTLGEEYCDITQVSGPHGLPPTPARRALFIFYQTAVPYMAERISTRVASRSITRADSMSDELYSNIDSGSSQIQSLAMIDLPSSSRGVSVSLLSKLWQKISGFWLHVVRRCPTALPVACEFLQLILRTNLMFFYFEGLYYHISKRAAGIRYVFIGKPSNQRPRSPTQQFILYGKFSSTHLLGVPSNFSLSS